MSDYMTPTLAQDILKWHDQEDGRKYLAEDYRLALELIAGMTTVWGVTALVGGRRLVMSNTRHGNSLPSGGRWFPTKAMAEDFMHTVTAPEPRLTHRYVTDRTDHD